MKASHKIYHVELKGSSRHFYFGSKASIYEYFNAEDLGISYNTLRGRDLTQKHYENKLCVIRQGSIFRKASNRGKSVKS